MTTETIVLDHIAGSAFGMLLESAECPVTDGSGGLLDLAQWGLDIVIYGPVFRVKVPGKWLNSKGPWTMHFAREKTSAWPPGSYTVRLGLTTPEATPRRFEQQTNVKLEVTR